MRPAWGRTEAVGLLIGPAAALLELARLWREGLEAAHHQAEADELRRAIAAAVRMQWIKMSAVCHQEKLQNYRKTGLAQTDCFQSGALRKYLHK